mmetsp:Transcript_6969/g.21363  ORF Transcript_6969/g.21363 Transcript_6969/m.21363 type:complete len:251 (-) Transcript_6969:971-1723(-)
MAPRALFWPRHPRCSRHHHPKRAMRRRSSRLYSSLHRLCWTRWWQACAPSSAPCHGSSGASSIWGSRTGRLIGSGAAAALPTRSIPSSSGRRWPRHLVGRSSSSGPALPLSRRRCKSLWRPSSRARCAKVTASPKPPQSRASPIIPTTLRAALGRRPSALAFGCAIGRRVAICCLTPTTQTSACHGARYWCPDRPSAPDTMRATQFLTQTWLRRTSPTSSRSTGCASFVRATSAKSSSMVTLPLSIGRRI